MVSLQRQGKAVRDIAAELGITTQAVYDHLRRAGIWLGRKAS